MGSKLDSLSLNNDSLFFFFWPHPMVCGNLDPQAGIKPALPTLEGGVLTARKDPVLISQASRAMLLKVSPFPFISCVCFSLCYIVSGMNPKYCCCWGGCYSHK